jgi:hypothetical protein
MNTKKHKPKRSVELLYKLTLTEKFRRDVAAAREALKIPEGGIEPKEWFAWMAEAPENFNRVIADLARKHQFPITGSFLLKQYVLVNRFSNAGTIQDFGCDIAYDGYEIRDGNIFLVNETENRWRKNEQPFVKILIGQSASLKDVQQYIALQWHYIQSLLEEEAGTKKQRIRSAKNKIRDEKIFELSRKSRAELGLKRGGYIDIRIAQLMKAEGYSVTAENVRKIISRRRKLHGL